MYLLKQIMAFKLESLCFRGKNEGLSLDLENFLEDSFKTLGLC